MQDMKASAEKVRAEASNAEQIPVYFLRSTAKNLAASVFAS